MTSDPRPVAVVTGTVEDYQRSHPVKALLVVEISESSLPHDRLTKSRIYARAGIPEYWIVNLRDNCLEVRREPDADNRVFASMQRFGAGEVIELVGIPGARVAVSDLLPTD